MKFLHDFSKRKILLLSHRCVLTLWRISPLIMTFLILMDIPLKRESRFLTFELIGIFSLINSISKFLSIVMYAGGFNGPFWWRKCRSLCSVKRMEVEVELKITSPLERRHPHVLLDRRNREDVDSDSEWDVAASSQVGAAYGALDSMMLSCWYKQAWSAKRNVQSFLLNKFIRG
jgi:hypothetical protein